ncbi:hypothetical protein ANTPLA_LOCUS6264 [Anthophora plagiata]
MERGKISSRTLGKVERRKQGKFHRKLLKSTNRLIKRKLNYLGNKINLDSSKNRNYNAANEQTEESRELKESGHPRNFRRVSTPPHNTISLRLRNKKPHLIPTVHIKKILKRKRLTILIKKKKKIDV